MAIVNIVQGGLPSSTAITNWETANVSIVRNPDQSLAYAIGPGGYMRQKTTANVTADTSYNLVYRYPQGGVDSHMLLMLNHTEESKTVGLVFIQPTNAETDYGSISGTLAPEEGNPIGQLFAIENMSSKTIYLSAIEWYFDSSEAVDKLDPQDFISKAFLYGLDADKPDLTSVGGGPNS